MKRPSPFALFTGAVIASLGVALGQLTWHLAGYSGTAPSQVPIRPTLRQAPVDPEPIIALAPFGRAEAGTIPMTRLPLLLQGVLQMEPRQASSALIASGNEPARDYVVGDRLPGGAQLEAVEVDHVLIRTNGRVERLSFPEPVAPPPAPPTASSPSAPQTEIKE